MLKSFVRRVFQLIVLTMLTAAVVVGCNAAGPNGAPSSSQPLVVGSSPWPGFAPHYVALEKGFFEQEGLSVTDNYFQIATDVNTGLLAGQLDIALTGVPDMVVLASEDPSLRLFMLTDYSDGADGILARNVSGPEDLRGKDVAWESLPLQALLLRKYLELGGLTEADVQLVNISAAEAAAAFAAGRIDVAISYEPWLTQAAEKGEGEIIFSSKDTNIIPVGAVSREAVLQDRQADIQAYLRGYNEGVQFVRDNPAEAADIVADKLGVTPDEVPALMATVRIFDLQENQALVFNPDEPLNVMDSLDFAAKTSEDIGIITSPVDGRALYDDSLVKGM